MAVGTARTRLGLGLFILAAALYLPSLDHAWLKRIKRQTSHFTDNEKALLVENLDLRPQCGVVFGLHMPVIRQALDAHKPDLIVTRTYDLGKPFSKGC